jgi:hypothetical protein
MTAGLLIWVTLNTVCNPVPSHPLFCQCLRYPDTRLHTITGYFMWNSILPIFKLYNFTYFPANECCKQISKQQKKDIFKSTQHVNNILFRIKVFQAAARWFYFASKEEFLKEVKWHPSTSPSTSTPCTNVYKHSSYSIQNLCKESGKFSGNYGP